MYCVIHCQLLEKRNWVYVYTIKAVNHIRSNSLRDLFHEFRDQNDDKFECLVIHTEVRYIQKEIQDIQKEIA